MSSLDVLCIGQLAADVFCNSLEELPEPGSFVLMDRICVFPGGCPVNTAIVTAKFNLKTGVISLVGDDSMGEFVINELKKCGVITDYISRIDNGETGKTIILISKIYDRVLLHYKGINERFNHEYIDLDLVKHSKAILISSYISGLPNFKNRDAINIFKHAKENEGLTFLDVLVDPDEHNAKNFLKDVLKFTDYIILNDIEGRLITSQDNYTKQAEELIELGASNVVMKLGQDGSFFKNGEYELKAEPYLVEVKDPTGSGDAFNGGFIYGCLQGWDMERTMRFANIVGASAVTEIGCTCGVYSLEEIENIM
jgi:5-dehydro-2-deoxygluconokinase